MEYWGSEDKARKALASLKDCSGCSDCSYCSDCSDCSRCADCSDCSGCSDWSHKNIEPLPVPSVTDLDRRVYEAASQPGALEMDNWHSCEQTHCRAGWIVSLAGEQGRALEKRFNTELAAMLIYHKSTGRKISPVRFYDSNEDALADMRRCAEAV